MANLMSKKLIFPILIRTNQVFCVEKSNIIPQLSSLQIRNASFRSSHPVREINEYPEVTIEKNPPEWKYVEKLLAPKLVPKPKPKPEYPSGWTMPKQFTEETSDFFVERTKNFMIPVYLETKFRGSRRLTVVRRIQGDIWKLEKELRAVIEKYRDGKVCASRVNELTGQIRFHGDYVNLVKDHLKKIGF